MNNHSLKVLGLLASVAVLGSLTAQAQDKATLDLLVKKGVISQSDADSVAKSSSTPSVVVTPKDPAVKGLKLEGMIQAQYDFLSTDDKSGIPNPPSTNQFELRRVYLGAVADLGNGWGGEVLMDFAGTAGTQAPTGGAGPVASATAISQNSFEKIVITKKFDDYNGLATVGYRKVDFTQEEVTSSSKLKAVERSPATRYFDESYGNPTNRRIGFANRHTGIFWNGNLGDTGIYYDLAIADGMNNQNLQVSNLGGAGTGGLGINRFSYWAGAGYKGTVGDLKFDAGVYTGMSQNQNNNGVAGSTAEQDNAEWGWNPYVTLDYSDFELSAEFLQAWVQRGRVNGAGVASEAKPYGFNITPSYKINKEWEIAARYSYLDTNGRGTNIADVVRDGNNPAGLSTSVPNLFNNVNSYYIGVNYYIMGTSLKVSAGYEIDDFDHRATAAQTFTGGKAEVNGFRTQLQLQF